MKLDGLIRRLAALEPEPGKDYPHCRAVASMTEKELDQDIRELLAGGHGRLAGIESSPMCHHCQKMAAMSEEELDVSWRDWYPFSRNMKSIEKLDQRVRTLEQRLEPVEIKLYWSEDEVPPEHRDSVIRLRWYDERSDGP